MTTIRQRKIIVKGWTLDDIRISKILDDLNIPRTAGRPKIRKITDAAKINIGSNKALNSAIQMRKTLGDKPTPDRTVAQDSFLQPNESKGTPHRTEGTGESHSPIDPIQAIDFYDLDNNH